MKDCLVFGSGRSGTSLLTGMLHESGYRTGDNYIKVRPANPKGFFEDKRVNRLNEMILSHRLHRSPRWYLDRLLGRHLPNGTRWLNRFHPSVKFVAPSRVVPAIRECLSEGNRPFCYKDPRFSYTCGAWNPFLPEDTRFLVVFRHPSATAQSVVQEGQESALLRPLKLTFQQAGEMWFAVYRYLLANRIRGREYLFVNQRDLLDGRSAPALESFLNVKLETDFAEPRLSRQTGRELPAARPEWLEVYETLERQASDDLARWGKASSRPPEATRRA